MRQHDLSRWLHEFILQTLSSYHVISFLEYNKYVGLDYCLPYEHVNAKRHGLQK